MESNGRSPLCWAVALIITLILTFGASARGEDCQKAREQYARGTKLMNFEQRRQAFQAAVDLCPSFAEARVNLADALENLAMSSKEFSQKNLRLNNELLDRAIQEYEQATKINNRLFLGYLGIGENCMRIGLYLKARDAFKTALNVEPQNPLAGRAKAGLATAEKLMAEEKEGFKTSKEIVQQYKKSSHDPILGTLMGFEAFTAVRDRQRFINIVFDEWSYRLNRKETLAQLEEIGKALSSTELAQCQFIVEGHTDNRGGVERNQVLSDNRAAAAKAYLVDYFKIDPSKISTQGFGLHRPRFPNDTEQNMLRNRRVELLIIEQTQSK